MVNSTFSKFCQDNFTLTVVISVIAFRFLNAFLEYCCLPAILSFIDPNSTMRNFKIGFRSGQDPIHIGRFLEEFISLVIFLVVVYYISM